MPEPELRIVCLKEDQQASAKQAVIANGASKNVQSDLGTALPGVPCLGSKMSGPHELVIVMEHQHQAAAIWDHKVVLYAVA